MPRPCPAARFLAMGHREAGCRALVLPRDASSRGLCYTSSMDRSHYRRFHGYDYSRGVSLFITISTEPRLPLFGRVVSAKLIHSPLGQAVCEAIERFPALYPGFSLHGYVVMPDHVHFNLHIAPGISEPLKRLGLAIRGFKRHTSACAVPRDEGIARPDGGAVSCRAMPPSRGIWQKGYHDHICVSRAFIEAVLRYMAGNPLKWEMQHNQPECLRIHEPLGSSRLDPGAYWRGVGNLALLDPAQKIVSVRVSRRCGPSERAEALRRLSTAIDKGYALLSGFTSPGEHEVRDMALSRPDAKIIVALPSRMNYGYKPDSRYLNPLFEKRCLIIAQGIEEVDFGRNACLDLNAEIAAIAKAGDGRATYWRPGCEPWI